jgi:hypothetical protein
MSISSGVATRRSNDESSTKYRVLKLGQEEDYIRADVKKIDGCGLNGGGR